MIKSVYAIGEDAIKLFLHEMTWRAPFPLPERWALISIQSLAKDAAVQNSVQKKFLKKMGCQRLLQPMFGDINAEQYRHIHESPDAIGYEHVKDVPLFTEEHAHEIIAFIDEVSKEDVDALIMQCAAGVSRSGALATFACRYLGLDEKKFRADSPYIHPKAYIYDVLTEVSGLRGDFERFWEGRGDIIDPRLIFI